MGFYVGLACGAYMGFWAGVYVLARAVR